MRSQLRRRQRGSTLIICLVFLLILTMIGISSIQNSTLQEQMAGSARDYNSAFQAAEFALRKGEEYLQQATLGAFTGSGGRYTICGDPASTAPECSPPDWRNKSSTGWVNQTGVANVDSQPQYIIEKYPLIVDVNAPLDADTVPPKIDMYRITARGYGVSENSMIVLQSAFRRD
jgi:type IV pilus assembly protein PilX